MMRERLLRTLSVLAALALAAGDAAAQTDYSGIPWGTPARETTDRLQAQGYRLRGTDQAGDLVFHAPDGAEVVATMSPRALVGATVTWTDDPDRLPALLASLGDSLQSAWGEPAEVREDGLSWSAGGEWTHLWLRRPAVDVDSALILSIAGEGWMAEHERRMAYWAEWRERYGNDPPVDSAGRGAWTPVMESIQWAMFVDSSRVVPLGDRVYAARLMERWGMDQRLENGMMYNVAVYDVELDCHRLRSRRHRTTVLYYGAALPATEVAEAERQWYHPAERGYEEFGYKHACATLAGQR
jgi:hypothetical protein